MSLCSEVPRFFFNGSGKTTLTDKTKQKPNSNVQSVTFVITNFCFLPQREALERPGAFLWVRDARCPQTRVAPREPSPQSSPPTLFLLMVLPRVFFFFFLVNLFVLGPSPLPQLQEGGYTLQRLGLWVQLGRMMWLLAASKIWHQWKYEPNVSLNARVWSLHHASESRERERTSRFWVLVLALPLNSWVTSLNLILN